MTPSLIRASSIIKNLRSFLAFAIESRLQKEEAAAAEEQADEEEEETGGYAQGGEKEKPPQGPPQRKEVVILAKHLKVAHAPDIPRQRNGCDCGVFVLKYLELLLANPPAVTPPTTACKFKGAFGSDWFDLRVEFVGSVPKPLQR